MGILDAKRVCIFAHFDRHDLVADYVLHYLKALKRCDFWIVVASTSNLGAEQQRRILSVCDELILRENKNLDWGGWHEVYQQYRNMKPDLLLFCNDSVYGPVGDFKVFLNELIREPADLYGAVSSLEIKLHIQSWFMMLTPRAYSHPAFQERFSTPFPVGLTKWDIINNFEVQLSHELMEDPSLTTRLMYDAREYSVQTYSPFNASHALWAEMIQSHMVPFIKKEVLRDNPLRIRSVNIWDKIVGAIDLNMVKIISQDCDVRKISIMDGLKSWSAENGAYRSYNKLFVKVDFYCKNKNRIGRLNYTLYSSISRLVDSIVSFFHRN